MTSKASQCEIDYTYLGMSTSLGILELGSVFWEEKDIFRSPTLKIEKR